ncbi:phosphatidylserine decarboxylase 1 [Irineochytrium annulatum]|nr:phosphatidylserine decarboxylase 1 [Irineochytrium annulatum]
MVDCRATVRESEDGDEETAAADLDAEDLDGDEAFAVAGLGGIVFDVSRKADDALPRHLRPAARDADADAAPAPVTASAALPVAFDLPSEATIAPLEYNHTPLSHAMPFLNLPQRIDTFQRARRTFAETKVKWYPIPISLGIAFMALLHLYRLKEQADARNEAAKRLGLEVDEDMTVDGPFQIRFYAALPLRHLSRLWGDLNSLTIPVSLREPVYNLYSRIFNCNLDEMLEPDLRTYPNLGEFFYRRLKADARPIDRSAAVVSPADGKVLSFGEVVGRRVESVKGVNYSLDALLGRDGMEATTTDESTVQKRVGTGAWSARGVPGKGKGLYYCVIYLAPGDYHRFHSPADWTVEASRHFAGELLSVSPLIASKIRNLFVLNERISLAGRWQHGFFSMIPVGATNVGSIVIDIDPAIKTNLPREADPRPLGTYIERVYPGGGIKEERGQEIGGFRLGSTIVLVFEAPKTFRFDLEVGGRVKVGQGIGKDTSFITLEDNTTKRKVEVI